MKTNMPNFSAEQWRFLAFLAVLNADVPIHLVGHFVPLPPGPLFEVINQSKKLGWLTQKDEEIFTLNKKLPQSVIQKLSNIIPPEQLVSIIDEFQKVQEKVNIDPKLMLRLMEKAGFEIEAAEQDIIIAEKAVVDGHQNKAWQYFKQAADRLMKKMESDESKSLFLSVVLKFSNLSFLLSKGLTSLEQYLHKSHDIAYAVGDQRSHALINLHLGRLFYFSGRRTDAMAALSVGLTEIEEIGDEDIFEQAAGFLGIFYLMQGLFKEALPHLEKAARSYMLQKQIHTMNPIAPVLFSYCLAYLGEFHRAIGSLECNWRIARENSDFFLAATLRIILSTILYIIKKDEEAEFHLKEGLKEAQDRKNALAIYLAAAPLIFRTMPSNDGISKAYDILCQAFKDAASSGFIRQFASPWILELFYEFEDMGLTHFPNSVSRD